MSNYHEKSDSKEKVIFNQNEPTQPLISNEIRVTDRPVVITHWNPIEGEFICLMKFRLDGCLDDVTGDTVFVKDENCDYICMCCKCNTIKITEPGRYKLVKRGVLNNAQVTSKYISTRYV